MKCLELVKGEFDNAHFDKVTSENTPYSVQKNKLLFIDFIKLLINSVKKVAYNANEYTPEYVDLGLPSGIKWATCNIGAKTPEENGMYFSWVDVEGFKLADQENWDIEEIARLYLIYIAGITPFPNATPNDTQGVIDTLGDNAQQIVVTLLSENGINDINDNNFTKYLSEDRLKSLTTQDSTAVPPLENSWRIPTKTDWQELYDNTTRTWIDTSDNSWNDHDVKDGKIPAGQLKGLLLTSTNGNSIFLPFSGWRRGSIYDAVGIDGYYWSSGINSNDPTISYSMYFYFNGYVYPDSITRSDIGLSIRPIFSEK